MRAWWVGVVAGTTAAGVALAAPPTLVDYTLDPQSSRLYVVVFNDTSTMASGLAHDHVIQATEFDGSVRWSAADVAACEIQISFPVTALWPDPPGAREHAQIDPADTISEASKRKVVANLQGKRQLWVSEYPSISYRSVSCTEDGDVVSVSGDLTIRGVTRRVTVPMQIEADGSRFSAAGRFEMTHADFGFEPFTNLMGAISYHQRLQFVVEVSGASQ